MLLSMDVFETIKKPPPEDNHFVLLEHDSEGHQLLFKWI